MVRGKCESKPFSSCSSCSNAVLQQVCVCVLVSSNSGSYMTKGFTNAKNRKILYQSEDENGWEKMRKTRKELPSASNANINGNGG